MFSLLTHMACPTLFQCFVNEKFHRFVCSLSAELSLDKLCFAKHMQIQMGKHGQRKGMVLCLIAAVLFKFVVMMMIMEIQRSLQLWTCFNKLSHENTLQRTQEILEQFQKLLCPVQRNVNRNFEVIHNLGSDSKIRVLIKKSCGEDCQHMLRGLFPSTKGCEY